MKCKSVGRMCSANPHMAPLILRLHFQNLPSGARRLARSRRSEPSNASAFLSTGYAAIRAVARAFRGAPPVRKGFEAVFGCTSNSSRLDTLHQAGRDMRRRGTKTPSGSLPGGRLRVRPGGRKSGAAAGVEDGCKSRVWGSFSSRAC